MGIFQNFINRTIGSAIKNQLGELVKGANNTSGKINSFDVGPEFITPFVGVARRKQGTSISFEQLRNFSVNYDVARACINHRKRQIDNLEWAIMPADEKIKPETRKNDIEMLTQFFSEPAHNTDFKTFIDKMVEDLMVFDAMVVWKDKLYGGELAELIVVDGATMRIKVVEDGTLPEPPETAYEQVIKGQVAGSYTTDELYYKMMNPRSSTPYGLSPMECLVMGIETALKSQIMNQSLLTEGNVPEGFFALPNDWKPDQIKEYQKWFDTLTAGNQYYNPRIKFVPGGTGVGYSPTRKPDDMRFVELEKWLLMKTCAMFDVAPKDIGFIENMTIGNGEGQNQAANQKGLIPLANFLKRFMEEIMRKDFGITDLKFEWRGLQVIDKDFELKREEMHLKTGVITIDEVRSNSGKDPFGLEASSKPLVYSSPSSLVLLEDITNVDINANIKILQDSANANKDPNADPKAKDDKKKKDDNSAKAQYDEIRNWEVKCIKHIEKNGKIPRFEPEHLDSALVNLISANLTIAKTKDDVKGIFKNYKNVLREEYLTSQAIDLSSEMAAYKREKYAQKV